MAFLNKYKVFILLLLISGCAFGQAVYIQGKAVLAQILLEQAWQDTLELQTPQKPWSWADTFPVAKLSVPLHKIEQIVLSGASGRTLAFGPGHLLSSGAPEEKGHIIIGGHRDTHFEFLQELKVGQQLFLQDNKGLNHRYQISSLEIHDSDQQQILDQGNNRLTLVTCYPFNTLEVGGPLRYLVHATKVSQ